MIEVWTFCCLSCECWLSSEYWLQRNPVHLPIGEYLYKMKFAFDSKKENLAERDNKLKKEQANCHYVNATSQKLLGRLKERGLKQIFDCLDDDKVHPPLLLYTIILARSWMWRKCVEYTIVLPSLVSRMDNFFIFHEVGMATTFHSYTCLKSDPYNKSLPKRN